MVDLVALVHGGGHLSERRWERNWRVLSHTGISQKVTLQVVEGQPTDIVLRVGQVVVARETPPWVAAREAGKELEPSEDMVGRAFYAAFTTPSAPRWRAKRRFLTETAVRHLPV